MSPESLFQFDDEDTDVRSESVSSYGWNDSRTSSLTSDEIYFAANNDTLKEKKLIVDGQQLWREIHSTAKWGAIEGSLGMARLSLSDDDKLVRDYLVEEAVKIGCEVRYDQMGNIFAVLPGHNNDLPPIGIGSHLDTQPAGGRFDGILGVLAGLQTLRTIKASGYRTYAPIAVIDWTNEEGARFMPGCSGSAVWADHVPLSAAHNLRECNGSCTMKTELAKIGYLGSPRANYATNPLSGHFELHIEQGRRLETDAKQIGVVTAIQDIRWYRVTVTGERAHGGSTPMPDRADALVTAARIIVFLDQKACHVDATETVGVLELDRPSANTVPGMTEFTIDVRHPSKAVVDEIESALEEYLADLSAEDDRIECNMTRIWHSPAATFDPMAVDCTRNAARKVVGANNTMEMISRAGHDSALVAQRVPTSMIFVPSKDGISHAPEEFTSQEECTTGAQVLLEAVLAYDLELKQRSFREWEDKWQISELKATT